MGCYIVPTTAAIFHYFLRKTKPELNNTHQKWLTMMFSGGAVFGIVDHAWNGELLIGPNPFMDIMLGVTITMVILGVWAVMVVVDKSKVAERVTG